MRFKLSEIARITGGYLVGEDKEVRGVTVDSRSVKVGQLFVALKGDRHDGHTFVADAVRKGAAGVLARRVVPGMTAGVVVEDVRYALRRLVAYARSQFGGQVIAILGAVGKTTTKEMMLQVLRGFYRVRGPIKSYNNLIGVALTILNTEGNEDVWVLELGTNRLGEISELSSLARPNHVVYTKLGPEHLEGLGSTYNAVMEEYSALRYTDGFVLVPEDAPIFPEVPHYRYGFSEKSHFKGEDLTLSKEGVSFRFRGFDFFVPYPHVGFGENALAVASFSLLFGIPLKDVQNALKNFKGQPMRMERIRWRDKIIVNDAYNSNPLSVEGLLRSLSLLYRGKRILLVFGDMLELGKESERWHRWAGERICRYGISEVIGFGRWARITVEEAKRCGKKGWLASEYGQVVEYIPRWDGEVVAIKGSRAMKLEEILSNLLDPSNYP
ncbi:MAG: UDP-N-acetylmuramoyl-tripeptide--D-alanyl-D-alanine ligase [Thermotogae bacterium]|nr:UDP-N-acetylmuramoyl-tripeptide--D-alanyl-D-alanine ligase [Thermotogota bacterium]